MPPDTMPLDTVPLDTMPLNEETSEKKTLNWFSRLRKYQSNHPKTTQVIFWSVGLALVVLFTILLRIFVFQTFYIKSTSMMPTLEPNERIIINKLSYSAHSINRGDIVVIDSGVAFPQSPNQPDIIKRVIGLSGETIRIQDCQVYINDQPLIEPYLKEKKYPDCAGRITINNSQIPEGEIFVLGDNRENSFDSRNFKSITTDALIGRAFVKIWPVWQTSSL